MSRTTAHSLLGSSLIAALTLGGLAVIPSAVADDSAVPCVESATPGIGYTAQAPEKADFSETANDRYFIPQNFWHPVSGPGSYRDADGNALAEGWHSTSGAASVTITTSHDSGSWTLCFSTAEVAGSSAPNSFRTQVYDCDPDEGVWRVSAFVKNKPDVIGDPIEVITVTPEMIALPMATFLTTERMILDGEERELAVNEPLGGLRPGTWELSFWRDENWSKPVAKRTLRLPRCGDWEVPDNDPINFNGTNPKYKPAAAIKAKATCKRASARIVLDNRASTRPVTYSIGWTTPKGGPAGTRLVVKQGVRRKPLRRAVKFGSIVEISTYEGSLKRHPVQKKVRRPARCR